MRILLSIQNAGNTLYHVKFEEHLVAEVIYGNQVYLNGQDFTQKGGIITFNVLGLEVDQLLCAKS